MTEFTYLDEEKWDIFKITDASPIAINTLKYTILFYTCIKFKNRCLGCLYKGFSLREMCKMQLINSDMLCPLLKDRIYLCESK